MQNFTVTATTVLFIYCTLKKLNFKQLSCEEFKCIEKIKTISTTYMVAAGLTGKVNGNDHVVAVVRFALRLFDAIRNINEHSFNNFNLRVGTVNCL